MNHLLLRLPRQISSCPCANLTQSGPLVHTELAYSDFHIEAIVGVDADITLPQVLPHHVLVDLFAVLDLCDQLSSCISIIAQEPLIPYLRVCVTASRSTSGTDADEDAHFAPRPLVDHSLVKRLGTRVECTRTIIMENRLADRNGLERETDRAGGSASLPDLAIVFGGWFFSGVVGS